MIGWEGVTSHLIGARGVPTRVVRGKVVTNIHQTALLSLPSGECPLLTIRLTIGTTVVEYIARVIVCYITGCVVIYIRFTGIAIIAAFQGIYCHKSCSFSTMANGTVVRYKIVL
jgi:hypothetical protein